MREREREREGEIQRVREGEKERERKRERERGREKERERERERERAREREGAIERERESRRCPPRRCHCHQRWRRNDGATLTIPMGVWRNGSASDSRSEGWEFESLCPQVSRIQPM